MKKVNDAFKLLQILQSYEGSALNRYYNANYKDGGVIKANCKGRYSGLNTAVNLVISLLKHGDQANVLGLTDDIFDIIKWVKTNNIDGHKLRSIYEEAQNKQPKNLNNLVLIHKTYAEAIEFAGVYGMNAVLLDKQNCMHMARLTNNNGKFYATFNEHFNVGTREIHDGDFDIYWIGEIK